MMNDETRELLSAYLDGALPAAERLALEARLAASADLRRELEDLRGVSQAIKELPTEPLPAGFLARLQARRARGEQPLRDWVFLPPAMRPVALALSCGVVALVLWDKIEPPPPLPPRHGENEAKVAPAADAPTARFDVSKRAAGASGAGAFDELAGEQGLSVAGAAPEPVRRGEVLPTLGETDSKPAAAARPALQTGSLASVRGSARAPGQPLESGVSGGSGAPEAALTDRTRLAMTEEERSARNEQMFDYIESQKKKMGIAQVMPKSSRARAAAALSAPAISAPAPTLLKKSEREGPAAADSVLEKKMFGPGRLAPDAGLVFSDARSLGSSWVLLGFPGIPPTTDFSAGRLVLIKPSATKIVAVSSDAGAVTVTFRSLLPDETADPAKDRVAPIPGEPKTVLILDSSPR